MPENKGFINLLSLFSIGFLLVSLIVGASVVTNSNINLDLRKRADVGRPEYSSPPISSPSVHPSSSPVSSPESLGCSPCNCEGISTCPYGGQISCKPPTSCSQSPSPSPSTSSCTQQGGIPTTSSPCCAGLVKVTSQYGPSCQIAQSCTQTQKCQAEGLSSFVYTCSNGYWTKQSRCDFGCDGNNCRSGGCTPGEKMCQGNNLKTCTNNGQNWTTSYCPNGCTQGSCIFPSSSPSIVPSPLVDPVSLGCSPCNCEGISTCPYGGQISCTPPDTCNIEPSPGATYNPCLSSPNSPQCTTYLATLQIQEDIQEFQENLQDACNDPARQDECQQLQDQQLINNVGVMIAAGIPLAIAGASVIPELALGLYSYGTAAFATAPVWAQTALTGTTLAAGWYGIAQGTSACNQNPGSMACSSFLAGAAVDPSDFINLGNQTGTFLTNTYNSVSSGISNYFANQIQSNLPNFSGTSYWDNVNPTNSNILLNNYALTGTNYAQGSNLSIINNTYINGKGTQQVIIDPNVDTILDDYLTAASSYIRSSRNQNTISRVNLAQEYVTNTFPGYNAGTSNRESIYNVMSTQQQIYSNNQGTAYLGEFINCNSAVCREQALILHTVLADVGKNSEVVTGIVGGRGKHAWVETIDSITGQEMVADSVWNFVLPRNEAYETYGGVENIQRFIFASP